MLIPCPFCGSRDANEFSYLGDAGVPRDKPNADAVYIRPNPMGRHRELWQHLSGCRLWLVVTRDTRTHEVFEAVPASESAA